MDIYVVKAVKHKKSSRTTVMPFYLYIYIYVALLYYCTHLKYMHVLSQYCIPPILFISIRNAKLA